MIGLIFGETDFPIQILKKIDVEKFYLQEKLKNQNFLKFD